MQYTTKYWICKRTCKSNILGNNYLPAYLLAPLICLEPILLPLSPLISKIHTTALPHRIVIPVTPMPLNCPPKNKALIVNNTNQYNIPVIAQVMSFLLLIIRQAVFVPIIDVASNIIAIP